jgi:hypothetical protein
MLYITVVHWKRSGLYISWMLSNVCLLECVCLQASYLHRRIYLLIYIYIYIYIYRKICTYQYECNIKSLIYVYNCINCCANRHRNSELYYRIISDDCKWFKFASSNHFYIYFRRVPLTGQIFVKLGDGCCWIFLIPIHPAVYFYNINDRNTPSNITT